MSPTPPKHFFLYGRFAQFRTHPPENFVLYGPLAPKQGVTTGHDPQIILFFVALACTPGYMVGGAINAPCFFLFCRCSCVATCVHG